MPAKFSTSFGRNIIKRSLRSVVDPHPTAAERKRALSFFENRCAYCDEPVQPKVNLHWDHVRSHEDGGCNYIANRVPACRDCNEKEKLQLPWKEFLRQKATSNTLFARRKARIEKWMKSCQPATELTRELLHCLETEIVGVTRRFDIAVQRLRKRRN